MTADDLAKILKVGRVTIFRLKKRYPKEAPPFDDVAQWRVFIERAQQEPRASTTQEAGQVTASNLNYVAARALRTQTAAELDLIKLEATRRNIIRKEEVKVIFQRIAAIVRGRFLKVRYDLPCACVGLTEAQIDKVVGEKFEYAMAALVIDAEFFEPASVV